MKSARPCFAASDPNQSAAQISVTGRLCAAKRPAAMQRKRGSLEPKAPVKPLEEERFQSFAPRPRRLTARRGAEVFNIV